MAAEYYIGIMSGTSHDGIDAALVQLESGRLTLIDTAFTGFSDTYRSQLLAFNHSNNRCSIDQVLPAGREFSNLVHQLIHTLLAKTNIDSSRITAIGCHGHTLRHNPSGELGYSYQLVDGGPPEAKHPGTAVGPQPVDDVTNPGDARGP